MNDAGLKCLDICTDTLESLGFLFFSPTTPGALLLLLLFLGPPPVQNAAINAKPEEKRLASWRNRYC